MQEYITLKGNANAHAKISARPNAERFKASISREIEALKRLETEGLLT